MPFRVQASDPVYTGWFLAQITAVLAPVTTGGTTPLIPFTLIGYVPPENTDPSTGYAYQFVEVQLQTSNTYTPKIGGRKGTAANPGIPTASGLLAVGSIVLARQGFGVGGLEWELLALPVVTASGNATPQDVPDQIEDGSLPALNSLGNLTATNVLVTNYQYNGAPAQQITITPPGSISSTNPALQIVVARNGDGNGNLTITQTVVSSLAVAQTPVTGPGSTTNVVSASTGWSRQTTFTGQTGPAQLVIDQFVLDNPTTGVPIVGTITWTPTLVTGPGSTLNAQGQIFGILSPTISLVQQLANNAGYSQISGPGSVTYPLAVAQGGTGGTTQATAQAGLGLGSAATQSSSAFDAAGAAAAVQAAVAAAYALLASPAFTGTPTAPTATAGTSTTQIATTAYVQTAVAGGAAGDRLATLVYAAVAVTGSVTLSANKMHTVTISSAATLTLPSSPATGTVIGVAIDSTSTALATLSGTINGVASKVLWAGESFETWYDGSKWRLLSYHGNPMCASVYQVNSGSGQSISTGTVTTVTLDTVALDTTGGLMTGVTSRITVPRTGTYRFTVSVGLAGNAAGTSGITAAANRFAVEGYNHPTTSTTQLYAEISGGSGGFPCVGASGVVSLSANNYSYLQAFQNSGSTQYCVASAPQTFAALDEIPAW